MRNIDYMTGERLKSMQTGSIGNNTRIFYNGRRYIVLLHENPIAYYDGKNLEIDSFGYCTLTTVNRLNGVLNAFNAGSIRRKSRKFYLNGKEWNGERLTVCKF